MKTVDVVQHLKSKYPQDIIQETEFFGQYEVEVRKESLKDILSYLRRTNGGGYEVLMDLTGVDYLEPQKRTKVIYFLHNPSNFERLRIYLYAAREESLPSVVDIWAGAAWYERELWDLFGVKFEGHPDLKRILMPDDWKGHPLRKDYALTEESVEFKHGVKPKVPSQIIPYVKSANKS